MPRGQSLIILGVAILLGLAAVFIAMRWVTPSQTANAEFRPQGLTRVVVARVPLDMGTPVTEAAVKLIDYPPAALPPGAFTTTAQLTAEQRVALTRIEANEPVLISKLSGKGGRASISALIDPAMRAATVRVNDVAGVGGFGVPGGRGGILFPPPLPADHFIVRARRIAESLELGVANANGVLVGPGGRYRRPAPTWTPDGRT